MDTNINETLMYSYILRTIIVICNVIGPSFFQEESSQVAD